MDQNQPRDDAAGAQPPADPNQAAAPDPNQAATGGGQDAAAEYAVWSADASYQQQPADTQPYAAPEPQTATYSDTQQYQQAQQPQPQPPTYDQQAYQQQPTYDQQAYQQPQQPTYDQQAYQQPQQPTYDQQPQQPTYDQQAYQQQYQQYYAQQAQQAQQYQQQQQPQYYDPSVYGQQPGYYDQSAYGQQQGYQQPYAYGQPGQQQPWPGDAQYWEESGGRYGRSFLAILGGFALLTWGIVIAMGGALLLWTNDLLSHVSDVAMSDEVRDIVERMDEQVVAWGGILLIIGIMHMIGAVGILAHRKWGRAFGIVLGLIGFVFGLAVIFSAIGWEILDGVAPDSALTGEEASVGMGVLIAATYLLVLLGMFVGRRQFRKKGLET